MKRRHLLSSLDNTNLERGSFFKSIRTLLFIVLLSAPAISPLYAQSVTFSYTGAVQTYTVPAGATSLNVDVIGAPGGNANIGTTAKPGGGRVQAVLTVTPGQVLALYVGGSGATGLPTGGATGGFNGGGNTSGGGTYGGGGGGGASDIRISPFTLADRVVVAGGGGGNGFNGSDFPGGPGGNLTGGAGTADASPGSTAAGGGTPSAGGTAGAYTSISPASPGTFGNGGAGGGDLSISGGGGGGWYGGGGGVWGGGGGGSSYMDATHVTMIAMTQGFNSTTNGSIVVTPIGPVFTSPHDTLSICINSGAASIDGLLDVFYYSTNTLTWSTGTAPAHGTLSASYSTAGINGIIAPSGTTYTPATGYAGHDTFVVKVSDGSTDAFDTVYVTVSSGAVITGLSGVCIGLTTTLNSSVSGGTWASLDASIATIGSTSGIVTGVSAGTVLISYAATTACTASVVFTVFPTPVVTLPATTEVCPGATLASLSYSSASTLSTYNIVWGGTAAGAGFVNVTAGSIPASPLSIAVPAGVTPDIYNGIINFNDGHCNSADYAFSVIVNDTPVVDTPLNQEVCNGGTTTDIIFTSPVSGTTYTWTNDKPAIGLAASGAGDILSFTATNTGTTPDSAHIMVTPHANGCAGLPAPFIIVVDPTAVFSTPDTAFACDSVLFHYVPASAAPGTTFAWSRAAVAGIANPPNSGADSVDEILDNTTDNPIAVVYTFTLTPSGCPSNVQDLTVTVNPTPSLTSPLIAPTICGNTLFSYVPTSATAGVIFNWMRPSTTGISNPASSGTGNPNEVLVDTTTVKVPVSYVYTLNINGCTNVQNVTDTVKPRPRLSSSLTPPAICDSTMFIYTPGSTLTGTTFTWVRPFVAGILSLGSSGTGGISEILQNTTNGNKDVTYVYTLNADGCTRNQNVVVTVRPQARLSSALDNSICSGGQFNYNPTSLLDGTSASPSYTWVRPATTGILPATLGSGTGAIHEILTNTTASSITVHYIYALTVAGECTYSQTVNVVVTPAAAAPSITTKSPASLCNGTMFQNFGAATTPATGSTYVWSATNASVYATGNTRQYALVNFTNPGNAVVKLSASYGGSGCVSSDSVAVTVSNTNAQSYFVIYTRGQLVALINDVDSYQWGYDDAASLDSTIIPGAIDQSYFVSSENVTTKYYWVITTQGDCMQKAYYNRPTGITNINEAIADVNIYPNPAGEYVNVAVAKSITGNIQVEVMNMIGQEMGTVTAVDNTAHVDVAKFAAGAYMVTCYSNGVKIASARFIKN